MGHTNAGPSTGDHCRTTEEPSAPRYQLQSRFHDGEMLEILLNAQLKWGGTCHNLFL